MKNTFETAVSPVIGVMLMLTITIIVTATLSAFVGGASTHYEKAPQASLEVYCDGSGEDFNIIFEHRSGSFILTKNLKIITWINTTKHEQSAKSNRSLYTTPSKRIPYIYNSQIDNPSELEFGEAVWKPGIVAGTENRAATAEFLRLSEGKLEELIASNTPVEVHIVHIPSGNTLLRKQFILE